MLTVAKQIDAAHVQLTKAMRVEFAEPAVYDAGMVAAIKQIVVVGADGSIELRATQLAPGSRAEITVSPLDAGGSAPLQILDALQASLALDRNAAAQWASRSSEERQSFPRTS